MTHIRVGFWLTLLFLVHLGVFLFLLPPYQTPDEPLHVDRIRAYWAGYGGAPCCPEISHQIRETMFTTLFFRMDPEVLWPDGGLPKERRQEPPPGVEIGPSAQFGQPPLYSWSMSLLWGWLGQRSPGTFVGIYRLIAALIVAPIPLLGFATVRELRPSARPEAFLAGGFIALLPMLAQQGAAVNSDAIAFLAGALMLYLSVRATMRGPSVATSVAIGASLSVGLYSKGSLLVFIPLAFAGIFLPPLLHRGKNEKWSRFALAAPVVAGLAAAAPGIYWWIEPLTAGMLVSNPVTPFISSSKGSFNQAGLIDYLRAGGVRELFDSFWGNFDHLRVRLPSGLLILIGILSWAGLAGLAARSVRSVVEGVRSRSIDLRSAAATAVLVAAPILLLAGVWWASFAEYRRTGTIQAVQGRYLFSGIVAIAAGLAFGLLAWAPERRRGTAAFGLMGAMVLLDLASVVTIVESYYLVPGESLLASLPEIGARMNYLWFVPVAAPAMALLSIGYAGALAGLAWSGLRYFKVLAGAPSEPAEPEPSTARRAAHEPSSPRAGEGS